MLNITNSSRCEVAQEHYTSFQKIGLNKSHRWFRRIILSLFVIGIVALFLPWTQNIQTKGRLTTLRPEQRPQTIHSTIAGRIEKWYVREGQQVKAGDTIVFLSEVKSDYFDPKLVERMKNQAEATEATIGTYANKATAIENQIVAMRRELLNKTDQLKNKIRQTDLKIASDSIDYARAVLDLQIAEKQAQRTSELYNKGLKSMTEVEDKRLKVQETRAKMLSLENKWNTSRNERINAEIELTATKNEYNGKIAKAESDRFSTISDQYNADAKTSKLQSEYANYALRNQFYYITAPQDCYITKAIVPGRGETVKEGQPIVTMMPANFQLAVEMFIEPIDLPIIHIGNQVNFIFDGWPAFVFSGWPNLSFGTFTGKVVAIDNDISSGGQYRVLVAQDPSAGPWPAPLRVGSGARAVALLNNVPLWYEIWRQLNGFPPDFYDAQNETVKDEAK